MITLQHLIPPAEQPTHAGALLCEGEAAADKLEADLAVMLDEELVPPVEPEGPSALPPDAPAQPPPEPVATVAPVAPAPRARHTKTVSKYPRLAQLDESLTPNNQFHGIRCVRNPLLHQGKWDSMRAICAFHGERCELSW